MRYLKKFERINKVVRNRKKMSNIRTDDFVILTKPVKNKKFKVGNIYKVDSCDYDDILTFEISDPNDKFLLYSYWVKLSEVRKATDVEIDQKKYNL